MAAYGTGYEVYETDTEEGVSSQPYHELEEAPELHVFNHEKTPLEQWHRINNLDDFFKRVYNYHQRHGFLCMLTEDVLQLVQFLLIVLFTGFLIDCVDYDILFATNVAESQATKYTLHDVIITPCRCGFSIPIVAICMMVAFSFLCIRTIMVTYNLFKYWQIRQFFLVALGIPTSEVDNTQWHEVQTKLMQVQRDVRMCVYKQELTQLDIHNRILRYKNFFISMINKSVLPIKLTLPFLGEVTYLTHGLKFNLELILFWTPGVNISPFKNPYNVKDEYKSVHKRLQLSRQLSNTILIVGILNLVLSPLIFLWHILYFLFVYGNMIKRDPSFLGSRKWSLYSRSYLRHFNELDHELNTRLCQAYQVSNEYMSGFMSPLPAILGRFVTFVVGAILFVLVVLTWYDEDVLQIQHMITLMGGCGMVMAISTVFIPPENVVFDPQSKMTQILSHIHYQPTQWKEKAHTSQVRDEFGTLFQFKAITLIQELLSPLITPLILIFKVRHSSLEIIDFYRNFSVEVAGVGDVCSFAQMDIRKHGNRKWSPGTAGSSDTHQQAEHGKTELSILHFSIMNPTWQPPEAAEKYLNSIRETYEQDQQLAVTSNLAPLSQSLQSLPLGATTSTSGRNVRSAESDVFTSTGASAGGTRQDTVFTPLTGSARSSASARGQQMNSLDSNNSEMNVSMLYMHELRRQDRLSNIGQIGYENLDNVRQVMTDSELHPVPEFHSMNETYGSISNTPSLSTYSTLEHV